jgi:diaminohydroxyphosphoribosylaminopyrimidine deaminase/5-amino-6-(5-phosphoribosylamino)uracil reductase
MTWSMGTPDVASQREINAMRLAIALSAHGLGTTSPNPPVGCVILDANGDIVGTGYHQRKGESHAEVHALSAAGERAEGGTAVVTLEPCNHVGRTPACRQALLDAKVARVVIAVMDPTSRGEGGAAALRVAGVDVEVDVLADEARLVLGPWLAALDRRRPVVSAAYSVGKDGPQPLEGAALDELRTGVDAVLYEDGRVEEGVRDSHGQGILWLPTALPSAQPAELLAGMYAGGVRSVLLVGSAGFIDNYATLVDELVVDWPVPSEASSATSTFAVPTGYRTRCVAKIGQVVRVEYVLER